MSDAREKIILIKQLVDTWTMDALIKNEVTDEERLDQLLALIVLKKQKDSSTFQALTLYGFVYGKTLLIEWSPEAKKLLDLLFKKVKRLTK